VPTSERSGVGQTGSNFCARRSVENYRLTSPQERGLINGRDRQATPKERNRVPVTGSVTNRGRVHVGEASTAREHWRSAGPADRITPNLPRFVTLP